MLYYNQNIVERTKIYKNLGSQTTFTYVIMVYGDKKYLLACIAMLLFNG
jgi:hypothetical protein